MRAKSEGAGMAARGRRTEHEPGYPPGNSSQEEISRLPRQRLTRWLGGWIQRKRRGFSSRSVWVAHNKHPLGLGTARRLLLMDNP